MFPGWGWPHRLSLNPLRGHLHLAGRARERRRQEQILQQRQGDGGGREQREPWGRANPRLRLPSGRCRGSSVDDPEDASQETSGRAIPGAAPQEHAPPLPGRSTLIAMGPREPRRSSAGRTASASHRCASTGSTPLLATNRECVLGNDRQTIAFTDATTLPAPAQIIRVSQGAMPGVAAGAKLRRRSRQCEFTVTTRCETFCSGCSQRLHRLRNLELDLDPGGRLRCDPLGRSRCVGGSQGRQQDEGDKRGDGESSESHG